MYQVLATINALQYSKNMKNEKMKIILTYFISLLTYHSYYLNNNRHKATY